MENDKPSSKQRLKKPDSLEYKVVIEGAGIVGTLTAFVLSHCVDGLQGEDIALLEKRSEPGGVNSHHANNAATLHQGYLEDYKDIDVIQTMMQRAGLLCHFVQTHLLHHHIEPILLKTGTGLLLATGQRNVDELKKRNRQIKQRQLFEFEEWGREALLKHEPSIMVGRDEDQIILARMVKTATAINFGGVAQVVARECLGVSMMFDTRLIDADYYPGKKRAFMLSTSKGSIRAQAFISSSGATALKRAHKLGVGKQFSMAIIAGNFFRLKAKKMSALKIYLLNDPDKKLPFSTTHADQSMSSDYTIIGPTTVPVMKMERGQWSTIPQYLKTLGITGARNAISALFGDREKIRYVSRQLLYLLPGRLGLLLLLKFEIKQIFPSLSVADLQGTLKRGGIRPQVIDNKTGEMQFGTRSIAEDKVPGFIANLTASPGASISAFIAIQNAIEISQHLGYEINQQKLLDCFGEDVSHLFDSRA